MELTDKRPDLCPTCDGASMVRNRSRSGDTHIDCPDCPTIGRLLAIGAAVMTGAINGQPFDFDRSSYRQGIDDCLAELRAVQPT